MPCSHIPTAILIPASKIDQHLHKLDKVGKSQAIITYCGDTSCSKSFELAAELKQKGYTDVKVYASGMPEWSIHNYAETETEAVSWSATPTKPADTTGTATKTARWNMCGWWGF